MEIPTPLPQHQWLAGFVGTWDYCSNCTMPDGSVSEARGVEVVRSIGGLWICCESDSPVPGMESGNHYIITLGYDAQKGQFVGSFISSCMMMMWHYLGQMDEAGSAIAMKSQGPSFFNPDGVSDYCDTFRMLGPDERELVSTVTQEDGSTLEFMRTTFRRRA